MTDNKDIKLQPCPFCGSEDAPRFVKKGDGKRVSPQAVICFYKSGGCGVKTRYEQTDAAAASLWNMRS